MTSVEKVKAVCKERKIPISKLEKDLGFANGYVGQLRKGVFPADRLLSISQYLDIPIEYFINETTEEQKESPTGETGEAKKLLTRDKYRDFLKELSMDDLIALNADIADEMRGRGNK